MVCERGRRWCGLRVGGGCVGFIAVDRAGSSLYSLACGLAFTLPARRSSDLCVCVCVWASTPLVWWVCASTPLCVFGPRLRLNGEFALCVCVCVCGPQLRWCGGFVPHLRCA